MKVIRPIQIVLLIFMLAAAAGAAYLKPTIKMANQRKVNLEQMIPPQFGDWKMLPNQHVIELPPELAANLSRIYTETLSRTYVNSKGQQVMLSIAYGADQSDGMGVHKPEVCYPAQGFTVGNIDYAAINLPNQYSFKVAHLVAKLSERVEPITYWIMLGNNNVSSGKESKLEQIKYGLKGIIPDGMLIRVSSINDDSLSAYQLHEEFIAALHTNVRRHEQEILFGDR